MQECDCFKTWDGGGGGGRILAVEGVMRSQLHFAFAFNNILLYIINIVYFCLFKYFYFTMN